MRTFFFLFFISGANFVENQENTEKVGITWYHYIESFLRWLPYVPFGITLNAFKRHCVLQDVIYKLLFLRHIHKLDANSSTQIVRFLTRCLPIVFTFYLMGVHVWKKILERLKCSPGDVGSSFDNTEENFSQKGRKSLKVRKLSQKNMFLKNCKFSSKCTFGHVEFIFDNPAEIFLTKVRKLLARKPKMMKRKLSKNGFSSKCCSGYVECSFNNSADKFLLKSENSLLIVPNDKQIRNII